MKPWDELSSIARLGVVAIIPLMWAAWVWLFTTFETVQSSELKWVSHNQAIACKTVYELKTQIRAKEAQIQFDKTLPQDDKQFIQNQIDKVNEEITRIDPEAKC